MVGNKRANVDVHEGRSFAQCVSLVKLIRASRTYQNLYSIILYNDQTIYPRHSQKQGSSGKGEFTMACSKNKLLPSVATN